MGVFLYSNGKVNSDRVKDVFKTRGHHNIQCLDNSQDVNTTLIVAPKIIVHNENYLTGNDLGVDVDYAIGIGTYFYKGEYGKDALKLIYDNLEDVLVDNPVYGHWAFCIHKNGKTYIFNDMSGFMRLYMYKNANQIVVSSSFLGVLSTIDNPRIDKARLAGFISGGYGREEGFIDDLCLINPLKYLVIEDGKLPKWVNKVIPHVKHIATLEEATKYVVGLFKMQMEQLKSAIGDRKIYIDATGGLDSRLIASNLKTSGFNFDFINFPLFGPDSEIAEILSKGLHKKMFVQTNKPIGDNYNDHYGEFDFGYNFFRQYPNPRWLLENDFEFSGARGECIDLPDIYSDEEIEFMEDPRIVSLIPHLCLRDIMTESSKQAYSDFMIHYVEDRIGIDRNSKMTQYEQVKFCQFLAGQHGDAQYNSAAQAHCYFYSLFNEWHFNHFISDIAFDAKSGRKLTIALIKRIDPELGSFPFVSRRRTKRNSVNEISELPMKYWGYDSIKKILPKFVVNYIYGRMGRKFDVKRLNSINLDAYSEFFNIKELKKNPNLYSDYLNRLYSVDAICKLFNVSF